MRSSRFVILGLLAFGILANPVQAQVVEFQGGLTQNADLTDNDWVLFNGQPSKMWGTVSSGSATASAVNGFTSLSNATVAGFNIALFQWSFGSQGDLELVNFQSPGPATAGFEVYENNVGNAVDITFTYDGDVWATGTVDQIRADVTNNADLNATGTGVVTLTAAGVDDAFFNEVMSKTGNTGRLDYTFNSFTAVNAQGLFQSDGSFTAVPEPAHTAAAVALVCVGAVFIRRRRMRMAADSQV